MNTSLLSNVNTSKADITWNFNLEGQASKTAALYGGRFEPVINRLLNMSKPKDGCWIWTGSHSNYGKYPKISLVATNCHILSSTALYQKVTKFAISAVIAIASTQNILSTALPKKMHMTSGVTIRCQPS